MDNETWSLLTVELIRVLNEREASGWDNRQASSTPVTDPSQANLTWDPVSQNLTWPYYSQGDYNQDGEVNISDLTPLGVHFGKTNPAGAGTPFNPGTVESVVDGSNDGEIGIADVTPIGQNFGNKVSGYSIYTSADAADFPASNSEDPTISETAVAAFNSATGNPANSRLAFSHSLGVQAPGTLIWVRPTDGTVFGTPSNMVEVSSLLLEVSSASPSQPSGGTGASEADPLLVEHNGLYSFLVTDTTDGDVTGEAGTSYISSDPVNCEVIFAQLYVRPGAPNEFTVHAEYNGATSNTLHFAISSGGVANLTLDPSVPAEGGTGVTADPYLITAGIIYQLQVELNSQDVTSQCAFQTSDEVNTSTTWDGKVVTNLGATGSFNVSATYEGNATDPAALYFEFYEPPPTYNLGMHPSTPAASGSGTVADPYQLNKGSIYSLQVVDSSSSTDITGDCTLASSDALITIDALGGINIDNSFAGLFNVTGEKDGTPTTPGVLYFTVPGNILPNASFTFDYVNANMEAPADVVFNASSSSDPDGTIDSYAWDFDGDGTTDHTTSGAEVQFSYTAEGNYDVELAVTDNDGGTDNAVVRVDISNTGSRSWQTSKIEVGGLRGCMIMPVDGRPAIVTCSNDAVTYHLADDATGMTFSTYNDLDPTPENSLFLYPSIALDGTNPVIAYGATVQPSGNASGLMVFASNSTGTSWGTPLTLAGNIFHDSVQIIEVDGGINVYFVQAGDLMVQRSTNHGASWDAIVTIEADEHTSGPLSVVVANGRVLIARKVLNLPNYEVRVERSTDSAGIVWPDTPAATFADPNARALCIAAGPDYPIMAYSQLISLVEPYDSTLYFLSAENEEATTWSTPLAVDNPQWSWYPLKGVDLKMINGKPALLYYKESNQIAYRRANDTLGTNWGEPVLLHNVAGDDPSFVSLASLNDEPIIAYATTNDNGATSTGTYFANFR